MHLVYIGGNVKPQRESPSADWVRESIGQKHPAIIHAANGMKWGKNGKRHTTQTRNGRTPMRGKILLVVGIGIGYVLGTRAGREKYDEMKAAVDRLWNDPRVQRQVDSAQDFVKDKAPEVAEFLADGAKKVVSQVSGAKTPAKAPAGPATRKPSTSASK